MHDAPHTPRDEEMLGQIAEMELALAKEVFVAARAAEDPEQLASLARAYQRLARSLRQSIFLMDRLRRGRAAEGRPQPAPRPEPAPPPSEAALARKALLRTALRRVIFRETERETCDHLLRELDLRLDVQAGWPGFADQSPEPQVLAFADALGLDAKVAAAWRDLPDGEPAILSSA